MQSKMDPEAFEDLYDTLGFPGVSVFIALHFKFMSFSIGTHRHGLARN